MTEAAVELQRGIRRPSQYRADQRRRACYRARGTRTRPLRRPVVGPVAARCAPGDRGRPRRLLPRRGGIRYNRELSGFIRRFRGQRNRSRHRRDTAASQRGVGPDRTRRGRPRLGSRLGGAVRRRIGQRRGVHRPLWVDGHRADRLAPPAPGGAFRSRTRHPGDRDRARHRRGGGAGRVATAVRPAGLAVLHDRWNHHTRRTAAGRCVRRRRGCAGNRCGGRELLRPGRCPRRDRHRPRRHRQARRRLSEQRRGLGRRPSDLGRHVGMVTRTGAAMGRGRGRHRRRMLPGAARHHRRTVARL